MGDNLGSICFFYASKAYTGLAHLSLGLGLTLQKRHFRVEL